MNRSREIYKLNSHIRVMASAELGGDALPKLNTMGKLPEELVDPNASQVIINR